MNSDFCVAVHAIVFLYHKNDICTSEQLAENICTHPARVRRVMSRLKKPGLLETVDNGPRGGYRFTGDAKSTSLADIAKQLEIRFIDPGWRSGNTDMDCMIASGMGDILDGVFCDLNELCYSRLAGIHISDINEKIFGAASNERNQQ